MSDFSTLLSKHIHDREIKTYALAQYCGLDRSNMYKIIKGQRRPSSIEMVQNICKFMRLSPSESSEMEEAYQITLVGQENYYRRKAVLSFFADFRLPAVHRPLTQSSGADSEDTAVMNTDALPDVVLLHSQQDINRSLFHIISRELKKSGGRIDLLVQPDHSFLMDLLSVGDFASSSVNVRHVICMNNNASVSEPWQNYNLGCLKQILPLYGTPYQYTCNYYYGSIESVKSSFTLFPCMVITSQCACLMTADMQTGFLSTDPASLRLFVYLFEQYMQQSSPLLCPIDTLYTQLNFAQDAVSQSTSAYSFQMLPCLTPFLTTELLNKYITPQLPEREHLLQTLQSYLEILRSQSNTSSICSYCSLAGIEKFLNTGRIGEYPSRFYAPFDMEDRIYLVRQLIAAMRTDRYRLLRQNLGSIHDEFYLFVGQRKGYFLFITSSEEMVYLNIEEPGLLFAFFDFCESLDEEVYYTPQEAVHQIQSLLSTYQ